MFSLPLRIASSQQVTLPFPNTITGDFTFEHWFMINVDPATDFYLYERSGKMSFSRVSGIISYDYGTQSSTVTLAPLTSTWHHIAISVTSGSPKFDIFVNGGTASTVSASVVYSAIDYLVLGSTEASANTIDAQLTEMRLWKTALIQSDIQQVMNAYIY